MQDLNTKYRPNALKEVLGHKAVVSSLRALLESDDKPQQFLFSGASGTGKTTLARIVAKEMGCDIENYDGGLNRTTDDVAELLAMVKHRPIDADRKAIIFDECHALSKKAWDSLLLSIEEPPDYLVWIFCTTEFAKVPQTIVSRCQPFTLTAVDSDAIYDLLVWIADEEKFKIPEVAIEHCANAANGSVRQAVNNLSAARGCKTLAEAKELIVPKTGGSAKAVDLAKVLLNGGAKVIWEELDKVLEDADGESARITIMNYVSAAAKSAKSNDDMKMKALSILEAFDRSYHPATQRAELIRDTGRVVFGAQQQDF